jgi:hypothetical protein
VQQLGVSATALNRLRDTARSLSANLPVTAAVVVSEEHGDCCERHFDQKNRPPAGEISPCMTAWNRLWSFVIRLLWPGSWKEHLRSGGRWRGSDENSTGPAVECGDVAHVDQNCPVPARKCASGRMHRLIDIYAHAGVFDPEQARIVTAVFDQTWQAVQDTGTPFASNGVAEARGTMSPCGSSRWLDWVNSTSTASVRAPCGISQK